MVCQLSEQNDTKFVVLFGCQQNEEIIYLGNQYVFYVPNLHLPIFQFLSSYIHTLHHITDLITYACTFEKLQSFQDTIPHPIILNINI
jgi:hypothetical protein